METVTGDNEDFNMWSHSLVLSMVRSTKLALHIADTSAIYSFFGNIGGAYTLPTLCYGLMYSVKSPEVETGFALPGVQAVKWLFGVGLTKVCELCQAWPFRSCKSSKFQSFRMRVKFILHPTVNPSRIVHGCTTTQVHCFPLRQSGLC